MTADNDNIIMFPPEKIHDKSKTAAGLDMVEQTVENIIKSTAVLKNAQRNKVVEAVVPFIFHQLNYMGVNSKGDDTRIGVAASFFIESLKALLSYHFDMPHPLHDVMHRIMKYDDKGMYSIDADKVALYVNHLKMAANT